MDFSKEQIETFKNQLEALVQELESQLSSIESSSKPVDLDGSVGRISRVDAIQQQQMAKDQKERIQTRLKKVQAALGRIKTGDYGICLKCEEPISIKRLEIMPEAPFCLNCQSS